MPFYQQQPLIDRRP